MGGKQSSITKSRPETAGRPFQRIEYVWRIPHSKFEYGVVGKAVLSKDLELDMDGEQDRWEIALYPAGFNKRLEGFVSLWLKRLSAHERSVRFACILSDSEIKRVVHQRLALESVVGWPAFCHRSEISEEGDLEFVCVLDVFDDPPSLPNAEFEGLDFDRVSLDLSRDLEQLLDQGTLADFQIASRGEAFRVHRCVLAARSPVFRAMFQSGLEKGKDGTDIEDVPPETMARLLRFLYSGHLGSLGLADAESLLYAADKYDVGSLQAMCSKVLRAGLTPANSIHVLLLAELHQDERLKDAAVKHVAAHIRQLHGSAEFEELMQERPKLAQLVLAHVTK